MIIITDLQLMFLIHNSYYQKTSSHINHNQMIHFPKMHMLIIIIYNFKYSTLIMIDILIFSQILKNNLFYKNLKLYLCVQTMN